MLLTIRRFQSRDVGSYKCIAKNSLGEVESSIRLYGEFNLKLAPVCQLYRYSIDILINKCKILIL